jgi:tricarballylate dehydrogenase
VNGPEAARTFDVVVVGAGNAGLSAALAARERGARVLVLEKAPEDERGGDTAFTGGLFRFPFAGIDELRELLPHYASSELESIDVGVYTRQDYADDLDRLTDGLADPSLVHELINGAYDTMLWLCRNGVRWMLATGRQSYKVDGRYRFYGSLVLEANGGGVGLSDQLFARAAQQGVEIAYESEATHLIVDELGRINGVEFKSPSGRAAVRAPSTILASGGFQANAEMRARYLGPEWDLAKVRGSRYDTGDGHRMGLDVGARPYGHWTSCHAVAWDLAAAESGNRDVGDLYQKHSYPLGIVVNQGGLRFLDEGADFRNYTYAKYGREILRQPGRRAFQIFDAKTIPLLRDEYRVRQITKARAASIEELAEQILIDPVALRRTIDDFNNAVSDVTFNPAVLDAKAARPQGQPPKSNWAQTIETPPFEAYGVTCGITFTFGGLRIDAHARVLDAGDRPIPGLYAAGELVGGLFYYNYPGGSGLMAGAVFGRRAGVAAVLDEADALVLRRSLLTTGESRRS